MQRWIQARNTWTRSTAALFVLLGSYMQARSEPPLAATANFGPYNATFLAGGIGPRAAMAVNSSAVEAGTPCSRSGWLRIDQLAAERVVVVAVGDVAPLGMCRCLLLDHGRLTLDLDENTQLRTNTTLDPKAWHAIAATYDGHVARLYLDGTQRDSRDVETKAVSPALRLAPEMAEDLSGKRHFGGSLAEFQLHAQVLDANEIGRLAARLPDFDLIDFHQVGVGWPWQEHAWRGLQEPQPAWTLPHSNTPVLSPVRPAAASITPALQPSGTDRWTIGAHGMTAAGATGEPPALRYRSRSFAGS